MRASLVVFIAALVHAVPAGADVCFEPAYHVARGSSRSPWQLTTPLPAAMAYARAVAHAERIIVFGAPDRSPGGIWSAPILSAGRLGRWIAEPPLPAEIRHFDVGLSVGPEALYAVNGQSASGRTTPIAFARFLGDGRLGPWQLTTPLPERRDSAVVYLDAGFLHVAGGSFIGNSHADAWRAPIQPGGALGAWAREASLPQPLSRGVVIATDAAFYVVGGYENVFDSHSQPVVKLVTTHATTRFATPRGADAGTRWTRFEIAPPPFDAALVGAGGRLYAVGGTSGGCGCCSAGWPIEVFDRVMSTTLGAGDAPAWSPRGSLPSGRDSSAALAVGDYLYLIGGHDTASSSEVLVAHEPAVRSPGLFSGGCGCRSASGGDALALGLVALFAVCRRRRDCNLPLRNGYDRIAAQL